MTATMKRRITTFIIATIMPMLAMTSCSDDDDNKEREPVSLTLSAMIEAEDGDIVQDVVKVRAIASAMPAITGEWAGGETDEIFLAESDFSDNAFSIRLPSQPSDLSLMGKLFADGVPEGVSTSNPELKALRMFLIGYDSDGEQVVLFSEEAGNTYVEYGYADGDAVITGSMPVPEPEPGGLETIEFSLDVRKGWNRIAFTTKDKTRTISSTIPATQWEWWPLFIPGL